MIRGSAPLNTIDYYEGVVKKMGQKDVDSFVRLYMVPGMQHCGGGPEVRDLVRRSLLI